MALYVYVCHDGWFAITLCACAQACMTDIFMKHKKLTVVPVLQASSSETWQAVVVPMVANHIYVIRFENNVSSLV